VDDEALRCRPDVVERIAGDQRQRISFERTQDRHVRWSDNPRVAHQVLEIAARRPHRQAIADPNVLQGTEEAVTVRGDSAVARFPWQRCVRKVAHRDVERARVVARHDRRQQPQSRNVQQGQDVMSTS
jgi:hypothetical protein